MRTTTLSLAVAATLALTGLARALPAFPGAEGFGAAETTGGRGGDVYFVTNLNDDGPGSLRDAVRVGNRTVLFRVSGTIELKSRLEIGVPNITIAGQTAPGDGIALRGRELFIKNTENVIVRFLRVRPGDEQGVELDAITVWGSKNVILDHCSMSWSTDSINDVVKESGNVTVQWCILSEPLNKSVHKKGDHGYATGWDGRTRGGFTAHHNLIAHARSRAPRIGYNHIGRGTIDVRNLVIYNSGASYGGETDDFNYVNNYFRPGPSFAAKGRSVFDIWRGDSRMFVNGNVIEGREEVASDNAAHVTFRTFAPSTASTQPVDPPTREKCLIAAPIDAPPVTTHSAEEAYEHVLNFAGAKLPKRDAVDERIIADVRNRTGRIIDSQNDVGGWPELKSVPAPADADDDGIPDVWETAKGLDPRDGSDARRESSPGGYTHLELYLNDLARETFPQAR